MQLEPECIGCLFNQVLRAFKLLNPDMPREKIIHAQKKLMEYLLNVDINKSASPLIGRTAYRIVAETLGIEDPYKSLKEDFNRLALQYYEKAENLVNKAEDPLFEAIIIAALGNTIDLASQHKIDFINDIKNFNLENLVINDYEKFKQSLGKTSNLLILGDNSGEIVFDKLLISTLQRFYPHLKIVYSVRSAPIITDVTIEDAKFIGLTDIITVVESCPTPGIDLSTSSEEFKKLFFLKGGVILSKGQGNFESLYGIDLPELELYYLLKAKCTLMERIFQVNIGDLIFKKKTPGF